MGINQAACDIAKKVSKSRGTIVAGGITQTGIFGGSKADKNKIQGELRSALEILVKNNIELIICEYFRNILEMEWAIEVALEYGLPVGATMCMGPGGDESGVSVGECAVRMARAGANLVGVNCLFDPFVCLDIIKSMKVALEAFELDPYLMAQPLGYRVPDGGSFGWVEIPEFPFSVEPQQITRFEARKWQGRLSTWGSNILVDAVGLSHIIFEQWQKNSQNLGEVYQKLQTSQIMPFLFIRVRNPS